MRRRIDLGYGWYLAPALLLFAAVIVLPFVANVAISLHRWRGGQSEMRWVGLENYRRLLADGAFWDSFGNSLAMIVAVTVIPTIIGVVLAAVLFDHLARKFGPTAIAVLRGSYYLPQILPIAVAGFIWSWILASRDGSLNVLLRTVGVTEAPDWLGDPDLALYAVMLVLVWLQIGYPTVIFMAALERIDPSLHEAAALDGAGWFRRFGAITLPQIRPEGFVVTLTATVAALKVFAPILILTAGGPEGSTVVPSYYAYRNFFELSRVGYGATISTVMAAVIFVVALGLLLWQRHADRQEAG
ncbi:carbohydrate ABC transporter permease [Ruania halotolerans]|uniref:carbohydrate ABC transporter permease n=1 Tax=Ruania halotolerans TaxID=2897773 RepID=UPI001E376F99|nr:sugar ABC transporter permease [Ruania halotolerans]UFU06356.1 sugar ABC transporter permease [Ruania halotolerans]